MATRGNRGARKAQRALRARHRRANPEGVGGTSIVTTGSRVLLGAMVAAEGVAALARHRARTEAYGRAEAQARALGRPLVVVGDPFSGAHTRLLPAYGCGNVCLDLTGCPACPVGHRTDLAHDHAPVGDDTAVVFSSCVLEYVPDAPAALTELLRMAGSWERVHFAVVQPWTFTAALYPGARWTVTPRPGEAPLLTPVSPSRAPLSIAALGALGLAATGVVP